MPGISGPALTASPDSGKGFRNHNSGRNFASIQNSCPEAPARRCRQALTAGRLPEINAGAGNSPVFKTRARSSGPALPASPDGGKVVRNQNRGWKFASTEYSKLVARSSGPAKPASPDGGKVFRNHNTGRNLHLDSLETMCCAGVLRPCEDKGTGEQAW